MLKGRLPAPKGAWVTCAPCDQGLDKIKLPLEKARHEHLRKARARSASSPLFGLACGDASTTTNDGTATSDVSWR